MKGFVLFICCFYLVFCKKERVSGLYKMLNDPDFMQEIEKRISNLDDIDDIFSDSQVGCYDNSGSVAPGCSFQANSSTIIKTTESQQRGAEFLDDFVNVSCPTDCTSLCCENPDCDTAVYQNKGDHKCYLFRCGDSSRCVFSHHSNYSTSTISKAAHNSHSYEPGGTPHSHENDLENLGSKDKQKDTTQVPVPSTTTTTVEVSPEQKLPELGSYCPSYFSSCKDPHAECRSKRCQCRVGYHKKHDVCRKHCRDDEFECDNIYDADSRQCVLSRYVCDGHQDCTDGSDEANCPKKNNQEEKPSHGRLLDTENKNGNYAVHPEKPELMEPPATTPKPAVVQTSTTPKPVTPKPTDSKQQAPTDTEKISTDSQASVDTEQIDEKEPVSNEEKSGDQSVGDSSSASENRNITEIKGDKKDVDKADSGFLDILNADAVEVKSYTDSSQGPIVALALGLAITMILLIFVGCRLRTVKRRLRKGRALHSNEADYLINGMYL